MGFAIILGGGKPLGKPSPMRRHLGWGVHEKFTRQMGEEGEEATYKGFYGVPDVLYEDLIFILPRGRIFNFIYRGGSEDQRG